MGELQAIIEFSVELHKFVNIDLFQRGYYQLRVHHRVSSKVVHKIEINFADTASPQNGIHGNGTTTSATNGSIVFPQCVVNGAAVSKTFQILYKNEEISLNDVISFKTHLLVDATRCIEQIRKTQFVVDIELWFTDRDFGPDHHNSIECVASRTLFLHVDICRGLHYHLPVMFDYFHLSAITVSIHGSLITLCQPYLKRSKAKPGPPSSGSRDQDFYSQDLSMSNYDMLLFGCPISAFTQEESKEAKGLRLRRAQLVHWQLCSILLTAIQSLRRKMSEYVHLLPPLSQVKVQTLDVFPTISTLSPLAQKCYQSCVEAESTKPANFDFISHQNSSDLPSEFIAEDYVATVESDMAFLCGSAIVQWQQFLSVVLHSDRVVQHLAKTHHLQRIKRFSEAFFVVERPRNQMYSVCDNSSTVFNEMSEALRKSQYLALLPRCDVECVALDGDAATLPIIYEEKFDQDSVSSGVAHGSASLNDIRFEERFGNLFNDVSAGNATVTKRNFKDKLLTRLSFSSPSRSQKLEYSPNNSRPSSSLERRNSMPSSTLDYSESSLKKIEARNSPVTLLGYKRLDAVLEGQSASARPSIPSTASMQDIKTQTKTITTSESLPDLTQSKGKSKARKIPPIKPPRQFRDDGAPSIASHECTRITEEEFEGTAYFPKPPVEFTKPEEKPKENCVEAVAAESSDPAPPILENGSTTHASSASSSSSSSTSRESRRAAHDAEKCTILEMLKPTEECMICGELHQGCTCGLSTDDESSSALRRISAIGSDLVNFVQAKENFRQQTAHKARGWNIYSDFSKLASRVPYFQCDVDLRAFCPQGLHLVICVHGLDGNSADLRLVKTFLELGLPTSNFEFLMSQRNQGETFASFEMLTDRLVQEITYHIDVYRLKPTKISFIGHSLGNIIIRAALARPEMRPLLPKLYTFLSLSGPHLGTAYNSSGLVNMGLWVMQKWKKSASLLELAMKDCSDPRQSYLYKLSLESGLEHFRYILLCGSSQDHYVPIHSAHIELCNSALNDASINGIAYREMVANLLHPLMSKSGVKLVRYDVHHALASNANSLIGRAAHIAVLDSELFIEKFMVVSGLKYFA